MGADPTPALQGSCPAWNPDLKKFDLISLLNVQAHFFGDAVNILVKHHSSVLRWKHQVVHLRPHFVTLVNVFAHPERFVGDLTWHDPAFASNWGVALDAAYPDYCHTYASHFLIWPPVASLPGGDFPQGMVCGPELWERQYWLTRQIC